MASLECNNCGFGIHYHDEPCDIEYTLVSMDVWNRYIDKKKNICRITLDVPNSYIIIWKCPECNCLHMFNSPHYHVKGVYIPTDSVIENYKNGDFYVVFNDFAFERVCDNNMLPSDYEKSKDYKNKLFASVTDTGIVFFKDKQCTQIDKCFKKIEVRYD